MLPYRQHLASRTFTWALALLFAITCSCSSARGPNAAGSSHQAGVVRYRLQLRENPVDPAQAFRCYGRCQSRPSPGEYMQCLSECPGFDTTRGAACEDYEVPPIAACFTARTIPRHDEVEPGYIVIAVIAQMAIIVSLASLCASSSSQCGYGYSYSPY